MYGDPTFDDIKRKLGHQSDRWQNIKSQREPELRITKHKIITDPLKIHEDISEEANEP